MELDIKSSAALLSAANCCLFSRLLASRQLVRAADLHKTTTCAGFLECIAQMVALVIAFLHMVLQNVFLDGLLRRSFAAFEVFDGVLSHVEITRNLFRGRGRCTARPLSFRFRRRGLE